MVHGVAHLQMRRPSLSCSHLTCIQWYIWRLHICTRGNCGELLSEDRTPAQVVASLFMMNVVVNVLICNSEGARGS